MADKITVINVPKDEPIRAVPETEGADGTRTPEGWFAELRPDPSIHAAAAQLHGWEHHKLHTTAKFSLTRAAYEGALAGVETFTRHADAVAPFAPKG